jgi:hypothetical protein
MAKTKIAASKQLLAWSKCRLGAGVKPGKTMTTKTKKKVRACVAAKLLGKK